MILCILKGEMPFKMHKIIFFFFSENLKKILGFTSKFRYGQVTLNTGIFLFSLNSRHRSEKFTASKERVQIKKDIAAFCQTAGVETGALMANYL